MSSITGGWLNQCTDGTCAGGIGKLYIANANQVSSISTNASAACTAITMTSTASVFYEVEFRENSGAFTETVTQSRQRQRNWEFIETHSVDIFLGNLKRPRTLCQRSTNWRG